MKKIFIVVPLFLFIFIFGKTFSQEDDETRNYLLTLNSINTNNIKYMEMCYDKLITIYPDNTFVKIEKYDINKLNTLKKFEDFYFNKILNISTTKYYEYKVNGIKINKIKVVSNGSKLKKCNNYLEKVEPI